MQTARRVAQWTERDGTLVLECPRPQGWGLGAIRAWLSWWTGPQRIRLDEVGSGVWRLFDGCSTLAEIADRVRGELGDEAENLEGRIDIFVTTLMRRGMVEVVDEEP